MPIARLRTFATCLHVLVLLVLVEALVRWVPLPRLADLLHVRLDLRPVQAGLEPPAELARLSPRAKRQLRCTWRVAARWPFSAGPCLRRSLVAAHLLRSSNASVRIGFPLRPDVPIAHAWVEIGGNPLEDVSAYRPFELLPADSRMTDHVPAVYRQCGLRIRSDVPLDLPLVDADRWDVETVCGPDITGTDEPQPGVLVAERASPDGVGWWYR